MPSEVVAVLGALAGVLIGGLVNYFTHRSVKNHEWRLALARDDAARRQKLYSEFLVEAQKLVAQAREEKLTSLCDLNPIYGKLAEIRLVAGQTVIDHATMLAEYAVTSQSNQPAAEIGTGSV